MFDETRSRSFDFTQALEGSTPRRAFDFTTALDGIGKDNHVDPREDWEKLLGDQRGDDLRESLNDWQKEEVAVAENGGQPLAETEVNVAGAVKAEQEIEEIRKILSKKENPISAESIMEAIKNYLSTWFNRNKLTFAAELTGGTAAGFLTNLCFTELVAHNPQMAKILPSALSSMQQTGFFLLTGIESAAIMGIGLSNMSELGDKYARTSSLAERVAVVGSANHIVDASLLGIASTARLSRDLAIRPGATGFVAGAWLYAALSGAGVFGESGLTQQAHAVSPADSGGAGGAEVGAGHEQTGGHSAQPDMESLRAQGKIDIPDTSAGQPPADQPPPAGDWAGVDEQLKVQAQAQAEAAKQAALEAARAAALNDGPTVGQLMPTMENGTAHEAILQMLGENMPHRPEATNALVKALEAGGVDIKTLHQGAIDRLAQALEPIYKNIDIKVGQSGYPYTSGGAAGILHGENSPEQALILSGNTDVSKEVAGRLFQDVLLKALSPR